MITVHCNSCGTAVDGFDHAITGRRANGAGGGGMPNGRFDWCTSCARTAFRLLAEHRAQQQARQETRPA